jgi:hypothetical protein
MSVVKRSQFKKKQSFKRVGSFQSFIVLIEESLTLLEMLKQVLKLAKALESF